jgi:hypothetical protein
VNLIKILDVDGNLLHEGRAKSRKAFVEILVKQQKSLARADLEGQDLTGLNLDDVDFEGANLDNADFRGTRAKNGNFSRASMRSIVAEGFQAKRAKFVETDFSPHPEYGRPSRMNGAILQFSKLDLCKLIGVNLRAAGLSSTSMCGAMVHGNDFSDAYMHNVDYNDATVERNRFHGTDMTPTLTIDEAHIPDRTHGAKVRYNSYKKTVIGKGNDLFRRDSFFAKSAPLAFSGTAAIALATAWTYVPELSFEQIRDFVGHNTFGFIGVASAWVVGKDKAEDFVKETFGKLANGALEATRAALSDLVSRGNALKNMSVAIVTGKASDALQRAMRDVDAPVLKTIRANVTGEVDIVIADRKKLAVALRRLSDAVVGQFVSKQDLIISRICDREPDRHVPSAVILRKNGDIEAVWDDANGNFTEMKWDRNGFPTNVAETTQGPHITHVRVLKRFIEATLLDNNVLNFSFDPMTHSLRTGRDGSLVVQNRHTAGLDNPYGPSVLTPDGTAFYYRQSRKVDENFKPIRRLAENATEDQALTGEVRAPGM